MEITLSVKTILWIITGIMYAYAFFAPSDGGGSYTPDLMPLFRLFLVTIVTLVMWNVYHLIF